MLSDFIEKIIMLTDLFFFTEKINLEVAGMLLCCFFILNIYIAIYMLEYYTVIFSKNCKGIFAYDKMFMKFRTFKPF